MHSTSDILKILAQSDLFGNLGDDTLTLITDKGRVEEYAPGEAIIWESDRAEAFYLVLSGRVKLFKSSPEGKEQTLYVFGPGEPFCLCARLVCETFPANASALETSNILILPSQVLDDAARREPDILFNMLAVVSRRLMDSMRLIEDLALKEIPQRVASFLLQAVHASDELLLEQGSIPSHITPTIPLFGTQRELAKMLGATPEALSRALKRMNKDGLILVETGGRAVTILDLPSLVDLARS